LLAVGFIVRIAEKRKMAIDSVLVSTIYQVAWDKYEEELFFLPGRNEWYVATTEEGLMLLPELVTLFGFE